MSAADYVSDVEKLLDGTDMRVMQAIREVAASHGVSTSTLQTAYYRNRKGAKKRSQTAVAPRAPKPETAKSNGKGSVEDLLERLKRNAEENAQITTELEVAIYEHVAALARVRAVLQA